MRGLLGMNRILAKLVGHEMLPKKPFTSLSPEAVVSRPQGRKFARPPAGNALQIGHFRPKSRCLSFAATLGL
jgi:hypothetical protein